MIAVVRARCEPTARRSDYSIAHRSGFENQVSELLGLN